MKIRRIAAYRVELPLHEGSYKWSGGKSVGIFDSTLVLINLTGGTINMNVRGIHDVPFVIGNEAGGNGTAGQAGNPGDQGCRGKEIVAELCHLGEPGQA